jgi:YidC/Oxa1 family membrane protein insertase
MEDQGKRLLIAVVAAMGIFFLWQVIFPAKKEPPPKAGSASGTAAQVQNQNPIGKAATPGPAAGSNAPGGAAATPVVHKADPADEIRIDDLPKVRVAFSKWGGDLVSWRLKDERYATTDERGELISAPPPMSPGAFDVNFIGAAEDLIPTGAAWQGQHAPGTNTVTYTFESDKLKVTKTFTLFPQDFLLKIDVAIEPKQNLGGQPQLALSTFGYQNPAKVLKAGRTTRQWSYACLANSDVEEAPLVDVHDVKRNGGSVQWVGISHPYFLLAMAPTDANNMSCQAYPTATAGLVQSALVFGQDDLKAGQHLTHTVWAYAGPKNLDKLEHADDVAGFKTGFRKSVSMGWFSFIARPLLWLLQVFYGLVGNWGIAIIMLTVLVKLATLYWTTKSMRSMRAMASLKPKMDELQKKYKDDRARQQQEMMALYKAHGVNPLAGCLPILLQMPIWLALYRMLSTAGELYNAPFIPGWINDLTAKDPYYILGVALVILMFVQAKLQPATGDGMQQKIMMYVMPGVFGVMSLFFPSGLTLYILTNTILTALHSIYMRKFDKSAKLFAAAGAVAVPAGAKRVEAREVPKAKVVERAPSPEPDSDEGDADRDGDEGDEGDEPEQKPAGKSPAQNKNANRQRRGKRRGGRN